MTYEQIKRKYIDELIPGALDKAIKMEKKAELLIYRILTDTLITLSPSKIELDSQDLVCKFFEKYKEDGLIGQNAIDYIDEEGKKPMLVCQFDMQKISEDFDTLSSDLYGNIPAKMAESIRDNSNNFEASQEDENIFQVNQPQKVLMKSEMDVKKTG